MAIFLKKFENHTQYEQYINSGDAILPNVSICTTEDDVHYNPNTPQTVTLTCVYVPTGGGSGSGSGEGGNSTQLFSSEFIESIESMTIDDNEQSSIVNSYDFGDTSEHTVTLNLKNGATSIGDYAFYDCKSLTSINIPDGVTSIGINTFNNCRSLTSITIPNSVTSIGDNAFENCTSLASITIPSGVTSIGGNTFYNCKSLTSVTIPSGVTSIGENAFDYTPWWYTYSADTSHHYDNIIYINDVAYKAISTGITSVTFKSGTVSIGSRAFDNCTSLTSINIPNSVISIGEDAFGYCTSLTSIVSNAATAPTISSNTFRNVHTNGTLTVPSGSTGYDVWMGTGNYYLGKYNWTKVEQ